MGIPEFGVMMARFSRLSTPARKVSATSNQPTFSWVQKGSLLQVSGAV
jgi:hypothetical protein